MIGQFDDVYPALAETRSRKNFGRYSGELNHLVTSNTAKHTFRTPFLTILSRCLKRGVYLIDKIIISTPLLPKDVANMAGLSVEITRIPVKLNVKKA